MPDELKSIVDIAEKADNLRELKHFILSKMKLEHGIMSDWYTISDEDVGEYDGECIGQRHFLELDGVPFIIGENNVKLYTPPDHYCLSFDRKVPFVMKPPEED